MRESVCHHSFRESLCLFVAKKKQMDSPSIQVLQRSRDSGHSEPEPVGIDNPFNALDFRQPSLIQIPQAGCLASTFFWNIIKKMKCPRCSSQAIVEGKYLDQLGVGIGQVFRPKEIKHFAFGGTDISIASKLTACTECGLLWSEIDKGKLLKVVEAKGNKALKGRINK